MPEPEGQRDSMAGAASDAAAKAKAAASKLGAGEQMVALGAAVIVLVDLIGDIIDEFSIWGGFWWFIAVAALFAIYGRRFRDWNNPLPYGWLLMVLGTGALLLTARDVINELEDGFGDAANVIFTLLLWGSSILMFLGGRTVHKSGR